ncbi:5237_t:CDS:2 [Funneliformis caledonium]|uniref:5237_t:CDS:1 n=1 Tax=Funneliformis caledonium TaxID=1117310 RepID=A0A9N8WGT6_9GLOM|nr:5237_t:CDS:2 [Funneliformis caledonium]
MKSFKKILFFVFLIHLTLDVEAFCKNYGKICPEEAPCCNKGWCSNDPKFCSNGCEPQNSFNEKSCYPRPPCRNFEDDFSKNRLVNANDFDGNPKSADWTSDFSPDYARYENGNLALDLKLDKTKKNDQGNYQGFGATVSTTFFMLYGTVTARIKTASTSKGVVTSMVVSNNTINSIGDEIDFEWVGLDRTEVQSNFYWNGTLDYTKGAHHQVGVDTTTEYHNYTIEWLPETLTWMIDGKRIRTVTKESTWDAAAKVYKYPSVDSRVSFSIWDGGMGQPGTVEWAGGPTDWSVENKVYTMYVDSISVTCKTPGPDNYVWPPEGYGPSKTQNLEGTKPAFTTLGEGQPLKTGNADDPAIIGGSSATDYNGSQLKKFAVPIGIISGLVLGSAAVFLSWRMCFKPSKNVTPHGKA